MKRFLLGILLPAIIFSACQQVEVDQIPAIDDIQTGVDPEDWAMVPAGAFFSGQHDHVASIDYSFEIMVTDVTNSQFAEYLNQALASGWIHLEEDEIVGYYPGDRFDGYEHEERIEAGDWLHMPLQESKRVILDAEEEFIALNGFDNHPMVHVTWFGARAYCHFYGWRLPTELEWEKSARGEDTRPFPWGWEIQRNHANYYSSHDIFEKTFGKQGDTTPVGFFNGSTYQGYQTLDAASPYGLYDMAGNVWQWTDDVYRDQHYRYLRGGSRMDYAYNLRIWTRNSAAPYYHSPSIGFRCVR